MPLEPSSFAERLANVETRIRQAAERSGRTRSGIELVAVSKKFSAEAIRVAYEAGLRDFGENYVQEFAGKKPELGDVAGARFHLIGHLQSNKARLACELFHVLETADSPRLIRRLDEAAAQIGRKLKLLLEIKLGDETGKTGAAPEDIPDLLRAAEGCGAIEIIGLMTIPPWSTDPEVSRPYFRKLAEVARRFGLPELSMGMSNDFEAAIEEGATIVRIGTALFGQRPKPVRLAETPAVS